LICLRQREGIHVARIIPAHGPRPLTSAISNRPHFDLLCCNKDNDNGCTRTQPKPLSSHFAIHLQSTSLSEARFDFEYVDGGRPQAAWMTLDSMIYLWMDGSHIMTKVASLPASDCILSQWTTCSFWDSQQGHIRGFDFGSPRMFMCTSHHSSS